MLEVFEAYQRRTTRRNRGIPSFDAHLILLETLQGLLHLGPRQADHRLRALHDNPDIASSSQIKEKHPERVPSCKNRLLGSLELPVPHGADYRADILELQSESLAEEAEECHHEIEEEVEEQEGNRSKPH